MTISLGVSTPLTGLGSGTTVAKTLGSTTAGRALVITVSWYLAGSSTAPDITSITCSGEADFTLVGSPIASTRSGPNTEKLHQAVLGPLTAGGSKTITVTFAASVTQSFIWVQEVDGANTAALVNTHSTAAATSVDPSVPLATTVDNCAIFAVSSTESSPAPTAGTGFTGVDILDAYVDFAEYDLDVGTAGSKSAAFINGTSREWIAKAFALAPAPIPNIYDAAFTLPAADVESHGASAVAFDLPVVDVTAGSSTASFNLPVLSVSSAANTGGGVGTSAVTLLAPTVASTGFSDSVAVFDLPGITVAAFGAGAAAFSLPVASVSSDGFDGSVGVGNILLPKVSVAAEGFSGGVASFAGVLPVATVAARGGNSAAFSLPAVSVAAAGQTGHVAAAAPRLPVMTVSSDGITERIWSSAFALPVVQTSGNSVGAGRVEAAFELPSAQVAATGVSGGVAVAAFDLPVLTALSSGYMQGFATAAFALPAVRVAATGFQALIEAYRTWCLNTRKLALTEYDSFPFNSYAVFNGRVLACGPGGVVELGLQNTDDAAPIAASARTGQQDFNDSHHKRVPRVYTNGSASGDLHFASITVEGGTRTYALLHNGITGTTQRRVPVGKGPRSRYFQFEVANVEGSDFSLAAIQAYPTILRRRVS